VPWEKLFIFNSVNAKGIKASISGFKLKTKLKNTFNWQYNYQMRESYIKYYTNMLVSDNLKEENPLVKKIKEYFLDTL
jgi:hypothetical protein